jgi:hypothetical protein
MRGFDLACPGPPGHCEERSDEAIQCGASALDCFASLAMTDKPGDDEESLSNF